MLGGRTLGVYKQRTGCPQTPDFSETMAEPPAAADPFVQSDWAAVMRIKELNRRRFYGE